MNSLYVLEKVHVGRYNIIVLHHAFGYERTWNTDPFIAFLVVNELVTIKQLFELLSVNAEPFHCISDSIGVLSELFVVYHLKRTYNNCLVSLFSIQSDRVIPVRIADFFGFCVMRMLGSKTNFVVHAPYHIIAALSDKKHLIKLLNVIN